ncbi:PAS domain-containing protein [Falsiroseomonas oryziterrae]|uniref:PAS domain-containing protein n=1 Tax=Falsiroseomonas oryziterrae TaxID=2911368 RepID=UPI0023516EBC|nr:PAS domain-containing protein [Roseomonas sp. NPKOSM-4]
MQSAGGPLRTDESPDLQARGGRASARRVNRISAMLLAVCIALPTALMALGAWLAWRDAWQDAAIEVEQAAETVAQFGGRILGAHVAALARMDEAVAGLSDEGIEEQEAALHRALGRIVAAAPGASDARVLAGDGRVLASATALPARPHPTDRPPSGTPEPRLERVVVDGPGSVVLPVTQAQGDGRLALVLLVRPDRLSAALRAVLLKDGDVAGLVRADGELLARSTGQVGPTRAMPAFADATANGRERALYHVRSATDGADRLAAARRIEGWPVYAVASRQRQAIVAEWRSTVAGQLAIGLPTSIALLVLVLAVRRTDTALARSNTVLEAHVATRTAQLQENEARLEGALDAGRVFAFEYHPAQDLVINSANAAAILGLPEDAARNHSGTDFIAAVHPEDRGKLLATLAALTPEKPAYGVRFRYCRPDGGVVWLQDQGAAEFTPDGRMLCLKSLSRDVTQEVAADAALREAEMRLRVATEGAGIGTYEIDLRRNAIWVDPRTSQVIGLPAESWLPLDGPDWAALEARIHAEDRAAFAAAWADVVSGVSASWSVETRLRQPDGGWLWDWCHGVAQDRDPHTGRPARIVGVVRDMTELRRMETELRQGQKMQALGALASGIAHDVNNVLQAISGSAAMALRQAEDPSVVRHRLQAVKAAVARGGSITNRLLAFSRRDEPRSEAIDPATLLAGLREILQPSLGPQIRVVLDVAPGLPPLCGEREQLQTALINLATNARDAMPQGGVLTLAARLDVARPGTASAQLTPGRYLRLEVRDSGTGMDAATLARVMEPFFTTKPEGVGTGLGLPLVKALAERRGGAMEIESEPGRGTTVRLWLPAAEPAAPDPPPAGRADPPAREAFHVLLVDDDPVVRETIGDQLREAGLAVNSAGDAAGALSLMDRDTRVDVLVTDLAMPGLDGLALIEQARRRRPGLAVVMVTGRADHGGAVPSGHAAGGPFVLVRKPASGAEIMRQVTALLGQPA